ncbi:HEAT repeat domain-containing protein [Trichothermofontia sichuanensis B231]|uniref:HEAT repeat domain-containing protein n=1 Tax=Trichothermofontia sichuanensis TaxID=3045816 RepID=UPI002246043E|nr:HEAT repeat domain-containing protein [Trichothermofontia sichuanensis]UZQ54163.1 HEAT repeat domain-containing protein [Trichothermofontia sichuanensis B231]
MAALATPAILPGTAGVSQVLLATLYDRDVRLAIVTSLGQLGSPQAIDALSRVAQTDADLSVRHSAAKALAQLRNDRGRS